MVEHLEMGDLNDMLLLLDTSLIRAREIYIWVTHDTYCH